MAHTGHCVDIVNSVVDINWTTVPIHSNSLNTLTTESFHFFWRHLEHKNAEYSKGFGFFFNNVVRFYFYFIGSDIDTWIFVDATNFWLHQAKVHISKFRSKYRKDLWSDNTLTNKTGTDIGKTKKITHEDITTDSTIAAVVIMTLATVNTWAHT